MNNYIIDVHCHLLNFKFIPDEFFKIRAPIRERLLKSRRFQWLAKLITTIIPGNQYDRLHELTEIFKKDIDEVAAFLIKENQESGIRLSIPLMMDLEKASFNVSSEIPYQQQIDLISAIALTYPGKILPFVMFDPRRENAAELTIHALEKKGFLGIKMYPPLGYHPFHNSAYNAQHDKHIKNQLINIYEYAQKNKIPITTHCSTGGAYGSQIMKHKELRKVLTTPTNWQKVLECYPHLCLNFAHFGGDFLQIKDESSWAFTIKQLIENYPYVYADLSYHDYALKKRKQRKYFQLLNEMLDENSPIRNKIIMGTDWSMIRHTWKETEYLSPFIDETNLAPAKLSKIALHNPMRFLFPEKMLPPRLEKFFKANGKQLPQWLTSYFDQKLES